MSTPKQKVWRAEPLIMHNSKICLFSHEHHLYLSS
jgi:hypothetical protein